METSSSSVLLLVSLKLLAPYGGSGVFGGEWCQEGLGDCLRYFVLNVNKNNFKQLLLVFKARPPVIDCHGRSWGCLRCGTTSVSTAHVCIRKNC